MRFTAALALILFAFTTYAADPVEEVRQAEIAFAKAFADRDQTKFFTFVADDATFMGIGNTLRGKAAVVKQWSRLLASPEAPFAWGPERVVVNAAGTLAYSTGPVVDPKGTHVGNYNSFWQKQADGTWKVLFDVGSSAACLADNAAKVEEGFVTADDGAKLYYRRVGRAPVTMIVPLDFIFHEQFRRFADIASVITYDPRNRGRSPAVANVNTLTIQQDVKDLEAVRKHFNLDRIVPVGYSYLGVAVGMYAAQYPERVTRVIQLGPGSFRGMGHQYPKELTHGMSDMGAPAEAVAKWEAARQSDMPVKSGREFCEIEWEVVRYMMVGDPKKASRLPSACALEREWPSNFGRHFENLRPSLVGRLLTDDELQKIAMPVLTIHGTYDRNAPYGSGRDWAMNLPDARLVTIDKGAHAMWVDDPVTVYAAIREFLRGDWPGAAEKVAEQR